MVCYFIACRMRKGCRSFICDTDQSHSNCMERFKSAYGIPAAVKGTSTNGVAMVCFQDGSSSPSNQPTCRLSLMRPTHVGNFHELQKHAEVNHPYSCPSKTDPLPELDWENVQWSSDIVNVFSTIHAEVPCAVTMPSNMGIQKQRSHCDDQSRNELISGVSYIGKAFSSFYESTDSPKLIMDLCKQMLVVPHL